MSETQSSRRNFLKVLGVTAGATVASTTTFAGLIDHTKIQKLNPEQKEFMLTYEKWMDEFIDAIRKKKAEPENLENHKKMAALAERAATWKPQLTEYMKDKTFALIYQEAIQRTKKEI
ncbi:MAG TPA: twin-arginine translocation signal domain-containing protein [Bacteroidia bacterium]|nr:twin-arginine translocation signal domain-containing protein [Bacteroidia bacterium]